MPNDLACFAGRMPYAREGYGLYQPLIGWKSRLTQDRIRLNEATVPPSMWLDPGTDFRIDIEHVVFSDRTIDLFGQQAPLVFGVHP